MGEWSGIQLLIIFTTTIISQHNYNQWYLHGDQVSSWFINSPAEIVVVTTTIEYNSDWIRHQTLGISDGQ